MALLVLASSAAIVVLASMAAYLLSKPGVPSVEEQFWGPGSPPSIKNTTIYPMNISFSEEMILDLQSRLSRTSYSPPLEGIAQEYGFNTNLLQDIVHFWQTEYPFSAREEFFNQYPHFKTNIQGLEMHYMHVKPTNSEGYTVLPILILHGWGDSFQAIYNLIPLLTTKQPKYNFVFEVIAPSLPGFAYSQAPAKPGCGVLEMSVIMKNLMLRIGIEKFYVHGGDWGSLIATYLATLYPKNVLGVHCTMCFVSTPISWIQRITASIAPSVIVKEKYADSLYPLQSWLSWMFAETGYFHMQATKPDTIGMALNDSPAGLAAYLLEKFIVGTNSALETRMDGGLIDNFKYVELIDNIMIYWVTNSIMSSMRIYDESTTFTNLLQTAAFDVPSACANFRHEILYTPESILRTRYLNLVHNTHYDFGGHYIMVQMPNVFAADLFSAVAKIQQYYSNRREVKAVELD